MNVGNISQNQNTTNFKAIKSIRCDGLYKKYPGEGIKLVKTFKKSPIALDFCKKYDVDIVFFAQEKAMNCVESSINILYKNPAKGFFKKLADKIFGEKDIIKIHGFGNRYNIKDSIQESTRILNEMMTPEECKYNKSGVLNSHIKLAEEKIESLIKEKNKKQIVTENTKVIKKEQQKRDSVELKEMLNNLQDSTK